MLEKTWLLLPSSQEPGGESYSPKGCSSHCWWGAGFLCSHQAMKTKVTIEIQGSVAWRVCSWGCSSIPWSLCPWEHTSLGNMLPWKTNFIYTASGSFQTSDELRIICPDEGRSSMSRWWKRSIILSPTPLHSQQRSQSECLPCGKGKLHNWGQPLCKEGTMNKPLGFFPENETCHVLSVDLSKTEMRYSWCNLMRKGNDSWTTMMFHVTQSDAENFHLHMKNSISFQR